MRQHHNGHLTPIPWFRWAADRRRWVPVASSNANIELSDAQAPSFRNSNAAPPPMLRIGTYNVLFDRPVRPGFADPTFHAQARFQHAADALREQHADIIGMQEVTAGFVRLLGRQPWVRREYRLSADPNPGSSGDSDQGEEEDADHQDGEMEPRNHVIEPFGQMFMSRVPSCSLCYYQFGRRAIKRCLLADFDLGQYFHPSASSSDAPSNHGELLTVANIHLTAGKGGHDTERDMAMRRGQLRRAFELLNEAPSMHFLVFVMIILIDL